MSRITLPASLGATQPAMVRKWRKKPGEPVQQGEVLVELETEQGVLQVQSPLAGVLGQALVSVGQTVAANSPIAQIDVQGAATAPSSTVATSTNVSNAPTTSNSMSSKTPVGKVVPILMPKAGQSMEEGTVVKWHVQPGATIKQGQVIFEIETDKATMEVEATDSGRVARIVIGEGATIKVLEPVAFLADNDADVDAFLGGRHEGTEARRPEGEEKAGQGQVQTLPTQNAKVEDGQRVKASPAARKVAAERGVDLATVGAGSGPGGRILSTDVPATAPRAQSASTTPLPAALPAASGAVRKRMSQMRKAIARNLSLSKQTIPHFYMRLTVNAEPLMTYYQAEKAKYPCSVNDVVVQGCAKAMAQFAAFRSRIESDEIVEYPTANIGIAVGMDDGLVVPVLIGAEAMSLKQIGSETRRLAANARGGKIEGMGQGLFTITNLGMFGVEEFSAIINPPEAAILAVGAVREDVIVSGGTLKPGKVMTMTLSSDHRLIDGVLAAKFMARLKELLEWPGQMG